MGSRCLKIPYFVLFLDIIWCCLCTFTQAEKIGHWSNMFMSSMSSSDRPNMPKCVDIPRNFSLCYGMQYNSMRLPNLLDHDSLNEVIQQSDAWNSLLRLHCHPDTRLFLCSLFAPICLPNMPTQHIQPCQSLCTAVQSGCESRMQQYGFPWPEMLRCQRFPADNDMCIKPVGHVQTRSACKSCSQVATFENLMDNFCRSTIVFKGRLKSLNDSHISVRRSRSFKGEIPVQRQRESASRSPEIDYVIRLAENSAEDEEKNCPCPLPDKTAKNFLVMASEKRPATVNVEGKRELVAKLIMPWKQDKTFKSAIRKFRKVNCSTLGREIRESVLRQTFKRTVY